jgi:Putative transposase of IS4/5 family (DUF4096)
VRRLLRLLTAPARERRFRLAWSRWRRAHQAGARRGHVARRARAHQSPKLPTSAAARPLRDEPPPSAPAPPPVILTDAQWARVAPLLPPIDRSRGGRPPRDPRPIVAALLWVARTGAGWRELPAVYGAWISPYRYHRRWTENGLWPRILRALQEDEAGM